MTKKKSNSLEKLEKKAKELREQLDFVLSETEKERTSRAPQQAAKLLKSCEGLAEQFTPGGAVADAYDLVQRNLKLLHGYDPKYAEKLVSGDRYSIPQTPAIRYICESLLSGILHQKSEMWTVLQKVIQDRKVDGNPFMKGDD